MKMKHTLIAFALLAGGTQAAMAADDTTTPYMGIQGTYEWPDQARDTDDGLGGKLLFGFPMNEYFAPEIQLYGLSTSRNNSSKHDGQYGAGLNFAVYPFMRSSWFSPFLLAGGGGEYEDRSHDSDVYPYLSAGGGFLINLNESKTAAIRVDAARYWVYDNDVESNRSHVMDTRINAGVQFSLGGKEAPPPPPPPPPAPKDTDGDGVIDSMDQCPGTPAGVKVDSRGCPLPPPPPPKDSDHDGVMDPQDACPDTPYGMKVDARGCAIREAKIILHDINFEFDSSRLKSSSKLELDKIAAGLKGQPTMGLMIEGHTDATGPDAYNMKLSKARANAARDYLISQGIEASRLEATGFGETKPIATNKTKEGRAENRRVEFKVTKQ
ncbi:OmpA family protein [Solimonas marina]|uniref:OmpA family protein n=1 Tax=Solimonas marina TaxID=2714601 RepID=A0A970B730_9GAMM|nr:OmpA family protein [Solimonas marina]NKF20784.1 OmpA family protein [Solimonas marina]